MIDQDPRPKLLENLLFGTTIDQVPKLVPGVVLASVVVLVAAAIAELVNEALGFDGLVSFILGAIVLGMIIRNSMGLSDRFAPGVAFTLKKGPAARDHPPWHTTQPA